MAEQVAFIECGGSKRLRLSLRAVLAAMFFAAMMAASFRKLGENGWFVGMAAGMYLPMGIALVRFAMRDHTRGWEIVMWVGIVLLVVGGGAAAVLIFLPEAQALRATGLFIPADVGPTP